MAFNWDVLVGTHPSLTLVMLQCMKWEEVWCDSGCKVVMLQCTEWDQFQSDLLMTVRVANDFKTEAQQELEKLVLENKSLRDKLRSLETQIEKLKGRPALSLQQHSVTVLI